MTTYSQNELKQLSEYRIDRTTRFIKQQLCHVKGEWQGVKFELIPWQTEAIQKIFGTLKDTGYRQYRFVYIEIPKKNGKSEFCSALGLVGLCSDDERGAEVYCAAADRAQASIVFDSAKYMVEHKSSLRKRIKVINSRKRMIYNPTASIYQALSNEVITKHGYNPSMVIFDELHIQPNRELYDVLTDGTDAARKQQLVIIITTAGVYDQESIGYEVHDYACQVRDGKIDDPTFLPIIYGIDDSADEDGNQKEDPHDPEVWKRVNPSLGTIMELENLETNYNQSKHNPEKWNKFCRLRLDMWVGQIKCYIPMMHWERCNKRVYPAKLQNKSCYGGLDLGSSIDLTAFILVFPTFLEDKSILYEVLCKFYIPEETVATRTQSEAMKLKKWIDQGYITATPGNRRDWGFIKKDVEEANKLYDIREMAYDRWGSDEIVLDITDNIGIELVQHGQGFADMSAPTKKLLEVVLSNELAHNGNPVLTWNAANLTTKSDAAENHKPDKDKAKERIDGIVALIMALGRAMADPNMTSVYDDRGIIFL